MTTLVEIEVRVAGTEVDFFVYPTIGKNTRLQPFVVTTTLDELKTNTSLVRSNVQQAVDDALIEDDPSV